MIAKIYLFVFILIMKIFSKNLPSYVKSVDNRLYRGKAVSCPYRLYSLKENGINQVIDLRNTPSFTKYLEKFFCKILGIKYVNCRYPHRLNVLPEEGFFQNINEIITKNKSKTYIHCQRGKRRTGISVGYYEKNVMNLPEEMVLMHLIKNGYKDLNTNTKLGNKYFNILTEFIERYLSSTKNV